MKRQVPCEIRMGYRDLSDQAFVSAFENCEIAGNRFRHADHVRLAWIYVTTLGLHEAEQRFCNGLRRLAAYLGVPEKFHLTMTLAWIRAVAGRVEPDQRQTFEGWFAANPELFDRSFLHNYYSESCLASAQAHAHWVEPNRQSLVNKSLALQIQVERKSA